MSLQVYNRVVEKVGVVDDDRSGRDTLANEVEDADLIPIKFDGRYASIDTLVEAVVRSGSQAVICDYRLNMHNYVTGTGAEAISRWYDRNLPAILFTSDVTAAKEIRRYRARIPVLMDKEDLEEPELLREGLEICVAELEGNFRPERRPWQTLVSILAIHDFGIEVEVPAWKTNETILLGKDDFPTSLWNLLNPDTNLFAEVNIGAERADDLYFQNFAYRGE